jgi:glucose-fructose oxidoreductase
MTAVRLALVGFGWFAELLVTRVLSDVSEVALVAVVDPSPERRRRARELGLIATESIDDLGGACDAVAILTPHDTHRALVESAAERGYHVFCEKAFAVTSADCLAMIDACERAGVALMVGHMQKLFPTHARAIQIAREGGYGRVVAVNVAGFHWCPVMPGWWRTKKSCGGLLYWTGIHDLDTVRAMLGMEPTTVYAQAGPKTDDYTEYEDSVAAVIAYPDGAVLNIQVAEHDPLRTFEEAFQISVVFERGSLLVDPGAGEVRHAGRVGHERGPVVREQFGPFEVLEEEAYREEFRRFSQLIATDPGDRASAEDGLRAVELLEAVYRSLASGQVEAVERVPLPSVLAGYSPEVTP